LRRADRAFRDAARLEPDELEHHVNVLLVAALSGKEKDFDVYLERLESYDPELAAEVADQVDLLLAEDDDEAGENAPED